MKVFIAPVAKPRMTRSDVWKQRPIVMKYRQFKDDLRDAGVTELTDKISLSFYVPMPNSWSNKKKQEMLMKPHQQKPDIDNYIKALFDAVETEDSFIWSVSAKKMWDYQGSIVIEQDEQYNNSEKD